MIVLSKTSDRLSEYTELYSTATLICRRSYDEFSYEDTVNLNKHSNERLCNYFLVSIITFRDLDITIQTASNGFVHVYNMKTRRHIIRKIKRKS